MGETLCSLGCMLVNARLPLVKQLLYRAALRSPELEGMAGTMVDDLETELQLNAVRVLYQPATPALLSLIWSALTAVAGALYAILRGVPAALLA